MKIKKSGIEMTPAEMSKAKAGDCACGCDAGYSGTQLSVSGIDSKNCYCGCTSGGSPYVSPSGSAHRAIMPEQ